MLNALTVDVEDYYHVQAFANVVGSEQWDQFPRRVETNTLRILELFNQYKVRATFFVLGWVAERCPDLVRKIVSAGHEIGCHGYNHQMIGHEDENTFREDVKRAKGILENVCAVSVQCYRAPSYSVTNRTLWALDVVQSEGFEYDSSIFPIVHDKYGIPNAPRFPYFHNLTDCRRILEFPPSTLSISGINVPIAGGGYFRLLPYRATAWALRRINEREHQPIMFYLHPWEIDPAQPRIDAPWISRFRHYHNLQSTEKKLCRLLEEFSWAPMTEVTKLALHPPMAHYEAANGT